MINYILFPGKFMFHQFMSDIASVEMIIDQLKFPLLIISKLGISCDEEMNVAVLEELNYI